MGFGLLFVGYSALFYIPFRGLDVFCDVIGYILILIAAKKLAEYHNSFKNLERIMYFLIVVGAGTLILQICGLFSLPTNGFLEIWELINTASMLPFHYILLHSLAAIADQTGVTKISQKARRNFVIGVIYYLLILFLSVFETLEMPWASTSRVLNVIASVAYYSGYLWLILNLIQIYSCYMWICREGDEEMPAPEKKHWFTKKD